MKLYIAGPMTGIAEHNFPAFDQAQAALEEDGFEVISPASYGSGEESWAWYLRRDLKLVLEVDGIAVLPGWQASKGARMEVNTALTLEMPVRTVNGWRFTDPVGFIDAVPQIPTANEVGAWLTTTFGPDRSVVEQTLVLAEETGEVCRAVVKREQHIRGTDEEWAAAIRKEAADVVIALLSIAYTEGFDLVTETAKRWADVSTRDSVGSRAAGS